MTPLSRGLFWRHSGRWAAATATALGPSVLLPHSAQALTPGWHRACRAGWSATRQPRTGHAVPRALAIPSARLAAPASSGSFRLAQGPPSQSQHCGVRPRASGLGGRGQCGVGAQRQAHPTLCGSHLGRPQTPKTAAPCRACRPHLTQPASGHLSPPWVWVQVWESPEPGRWPLLGRGPGCSEPLPMGSTEAGAHLP